MAYIKTEEKQRPRAALPFLPFRTMLTSKNGKKMCVELRRVIKEEDAKDPEVARVVDALHHLLNYEVVECGDSYPYVDKALSRNQFLEYFAGGEMFALVAVPGGDISNIDLQLPLNGFESSKTGVKYTFGKDVLGSFYIKPNYPYRSSHVCNGGFIVTPGFQRGVGVGTVLGKFFTVLARELGYTSSMFNLVYGTNAGSIRLWTKLGFRKANTIENGGFVKSTPSTVAALARVKSVTQDEAKKRYEQRHPVSGELVLLTDAHQFHGDLVALAPKFAAEFGIRTAAGVGGSKL